MTGVRCSRFIQYVYTSSLRLMGHSIPFISSSLFLSHPLACSFFFSSLPLLNVSISPPSLRCHSCSSINFPLEKACVGELVASGHHSVTCVTISRSFYCFLATRFSVDSCCLHGLIVGESFLFLVSLVSSTACFYSASSGLSLFSRAQLVHEVTAHATREYNFGELRQHAELVLS